MESSTIPKKPPCSQCKRSSSLTARCVGYCGNVWCYNCMSWDQKATDANTSSLAEYLRVKHMDIFFNCLDCQNRQYPGREAENLVTQLYYNKVLTRQELDNAEVPPGSYIIYKSPPSPSTESPGAEEATPEATPEEIQRFDDMAGERIPGKEILALEVGYDVFNAAEASEDTDIQQDEPFVEAQEEPEPPKDNGSEARDLPRSEKEKNVHFHIDDKDDPTLPGVTSRRQEKGSSNAELHEAGRRPAASAELKSGDTQLVGSRYSAKDNASDLPAVHIPFAAKATPTAGAGGKRNNGDKEQELLASQRFGALANRAPKGGATPKPPPAAARQPGATGLIPHDAAPNSVFNDTSSPPPTGGGGQSVSTAEATLQGLSMIMETMMQAQQREFQYQDWQRRQYEIQHQDSQRLLQELQRQGSQRLQGAQASHDRQRQDEASSGLSMVHRLPKLDLPIFSGDILQYHVWLEGWELMIGTSDFSDKIKFEFLIKSLDGKPLHMVCGLRGHDKAYTEALHLLQEEYGGTAAAIGQVQRNMGNLRHVYDEEDLPNLQRMRDQLRHYCQLLRRYKVSDDRLAALVPTVWNKIPHEVRLGVIRSLHVFDCGSVTMDQLIDCLTEHVRVLACTQDLSRH